VAQIQPEARGAQPLKDAFPVAPAARSFGRFVGELAFDGAVATVAAGLVALIMVLVESLSYAAPIFSGPLSPYMGIGVDITLTMAVVMGTMTVVFGSYSRMVAFAQNKIAALLGFMSAALVSAVAASMPGKQAALTVATTIFMTTVITGTALAGLGAFKLGALVRFTPYPLICGFLASVGWLLCLGALKTLVGFAVTPASLPALFRLGILVGDGQLPKYGLKKILETYYNYAITPAVKLSADYQFAVDPGYNRQRRPISIAAARFHLEF
jgi:MFS superfamily sulfate permease-like transporter